MTGWRHAETDTGMCTADDGLNWCGCITPTLDPASPCGEWYQYDRMECGAIAPATVHEMPRPYGHPHIPTRCTCGHAIEPSR